MPDPAPRVADRTTFRAVMAEILRRITEGPWGPGTRLPGEVELARAFGCSRTTMNRALREVAALGLLDRRRRAGTRVRTAPLRQARFAMPVARAAIEAAGAAYGYRLIARAAGAAPGWLGARLGLDPGAAVLQVTCLHLADGAPAQLEDRWINAAALPQALDEGFATTPPGEWLIAAVPYSEVEVGFTARAADDRAVAHLGHAPGGPVLVMERATWWRGAPITFVALAHPPGHRTTARY